MILRVVASIGLSAASGYVMALSDRYECEVRQIVKLDESGLLSDASGKVSKASIYQPIIGETFVVDRSTGKIHGGWLNTGKLETVNLISSGREGNQFRAVYAGRPPTSATAFLYIKENAETEKKPFMVLDSSFSELTLSGICE